MKRKSDHVNLAYENARKMYEKMEKEKAIVNYTFPTKPSSDGYYHVYLPDPSKKSGRRQIKDKNLDNLKEKVYLFEKGIDGTARKTFQEAFELAENERIRYVKDPHKKLSVQNSIANHKYDYNRYFKGTDFEKTYIENITKKDIENVCLLNLERYDMTMKSFLSLRGIIKSVLSLAYENYWIFENPYDRVNFRKFDAMLLPPLTPEQKVHSDEDVKRMLKYIHERQKKKPTFIPAYALELQILMGLRRGEVPPIEWTDVTDSYISITKEQLFVRKGPNVEKGYCVIVNHTKTYTDRKFPITDEIQDLLIRLKRVNSDSKYLFPSSTTNTGIISNTAVYRFYARMCNNLGIEINKSIRKGPHSFRRNGITKVANDPNGNILIASVLYGNSVQTASSHYYTGVNLELAKTILERGNQR